jgi:rod shape-determining protein MreD
MISDRHRGGWVIVLSFVFSFMLVVLPMPAWISAWRPDWVAMVLIYWCLYLPERVGVATGWFVGIVHDVLKDTLLGQHALGFVLIAYLSVKLHRQVRSFSVWQQAIGVFGLVTLNQLLDIWIQSIFGYPQMKGSFIYPAFSSMLLWPWLFMILRDKRRAYGVD